MRFAHGDAAGTPPAGEFGHGWRIADVETLRAGGGDADRLVHQVAHAHGIDVGHGEGRNARILQHPHFRRIGMAQADDDDIFRRQLRLKGARLVIEAKRTRQHRAFRQVDAVFVFGHQRGDGIDPDQAERVRCPRRRRQRLVGDAAVAAGGQPDQPGRRPLDIGQFDDVEIHRLQPRAGRLPGQDAGRRRFGRYRHHLAAGKILDIVHRRLLDIFRGHRQQHGAVAHAEGDAVANGERRIGVVHVEQQMVAGSAEHAHALGDRRQPFDQHVLAADIGDGAQPVALVGKHRLVAESVVAGLADRPRRLQLDLDDVAGQAAGIGFEFVPRRVAKGFDAALQDRLADAQIVDAGGQPAFKQQRQRRRSPARNPVEPGAGQALGLVGMGDELAEIFLASA